MQSRWVAGAPVRRRQTYAPTEQWTKMVCSVPGWESLFRVRNGTVWVCESELDAKFVTENIVADTGCANWRAAANGIMRSDVCRQRCTNPF